MRTVHNNTGIEEEDVTQHTETAYDNSFVSLLTMEE
jgi:hypothetical protein